MPTCPQCQTRITSYDQACPTCGAKVQQDFVKAMVSLESPRTVIVEFYNPPFGDLVKLMLKWLAAFTVASFVIGVPIAIVIRYLFWIIQA